MQISERCLRRQIGSSHAWWLYLRVSTDRHGQGGLASPEAKRYLVDLPIDYTDGSRRSRGSRESFVEHFRIGTDGKIKETQYQLASREAPSRPRKEGRIHRREKALGGCVLPSPRSEEVMALGAGAASVVRR
jgi:hypothetical protein